MRILCWFSCGAASAVAAKRTVEKYPHAEILYCNTLASEFSDNRRFMDQVAEWIERPIKILSSDKYASVDEVFERTRYMAGIAGARCTVEMKKIPREQYQEPTDVHVFGYTFDERRRAKTFEKNNPSLFVEWILIDQRVTKKQCYLELRRAGIELPAMYRLGFEHNNCIGCVKASSPKYWNMIRKHFPEDFARRARQSRLIGARLARVKGKRVFLDKLQPDNRESFKEQIECGPVCQSAKRRRRARQNEL